MSSQKKNAQTIKDSFENILITSKRKPKLIETDRGKEFCNTFQIFLNNNNNKDYSRITSLGAVFAERFKRTITDLLERPVFEKGDVNWVDILHIITKQYNIRLQFSTKLTPIQASLKKNDGYVYHNLLDKRKKVKPNHKIQDLGRVAEREVSQKEIHLIGLISFMKSQKLLVIRYQATKSINFPKDIMNRY